MSSSFRRYELLLPRQFNDGKPVPNELFAETLLDLRKQFGAVSSQVRAIEGEWEDRGVVYRDELTLVFVAVADTPENAEFFRAYKERLKFRFQQIEIFMTSHAVDVI